jgi:hypothetical protein
MQFPDQAEAIARLILPDFEPYNSRAALPVRGNKLSKNLDRSL